MLDKIITNGFKSEFLKHWEHLLHQYGIPFLHNGIKLIYAIYTYLTFSNAILFIIKYVPTGIYMYKFIKNIYITSRERMKLKQLELDELQLQIQIANTKLTIREAEFSERRELLRSETEKLRKVRVRVREIIADSDELKNAVNSDVLWDENCSDINNKKASDEESKFVMELLEELKYNQVIPELDQEILRCGGYAGEPCSAGNNIYSSAGDADGKQNCHVKIVKVTNVYKVAYLRHLTKQKRLRRANKQALLRKKILEDWQKGLNMLSKLSMLSIISPQIEIACQEAMGDGSKSHFCNCSDSDSDIKNNADNYHDEYSENWSQNQHKPFYAYDNYVDYPGDTDVVARDYYDRNKRTGVLYVVPEETNSQVEMKEIQGDFD